MTLSDQEGIFAKFEGDRWYERNRIALEQFDPENDSSLKVMRLYGLKPKRVLDLGGGNGYRLAAIHERYGTERLVVVEPSKEAIQHGQKQFPFLEFFQGVASAIPLEETFDLIIVNFVFHWIGRSNLFRSVAEIDRLLGDAGFVIIGDFLPSNRLKVPYHHLPNLQVYTYKQNYAALFLASGLYRLICALTGEHSSKALVPDVPEMERMGVFLLQKTLTEGYVRSTFPSEEE